MNDPSTLLGITHEMNISTSLHYSLEVKWLTCSALNRFVGLPCSALNKFGCKYALSGCLSGSQQGLEMRGGSLSGGGW
jgi:hypothetical protein